MIVEINFKVTISFGIVTNLLLIHRNVILALDNFIHGCAGFNYNKSPSFSFSMGIFI
jgi:hypothetical protein